MRGRRLPALIVAGVLVVLALAIAYPERMVSPGALMQAHAGIERDCFACHAPGRGAASGRCIKCHAVADIGLRTTGGVPLPQRTLKASFHQELIERDCLTCHSEHAGPNAARSLKPFSHALLRPAAHDLCDGCHAAPTDAIHRALAGACGRCHRPESWKPAAFDHARLTPAEQQRCEGCHRSPVDRMHRSISGACGQCHSQARWKPSTFEHDRRFVLDPDHNAPCATCHSGDYRVYSCYGCHAHRPDEVRAKHVEEGIRNFENCVRCHRSASGEPEEGA